MLDQTCIFCKIIMHTVPSTIVEENDHVLVIQDIAPKAPIHYLILPKHHIENLISLRKNDQKYGLAILAMAQKLGSAIPSKAFNLIINNGQEAGQSVSHLHMHLLSGKNLYENGLRL